MKKKCKENRSRILVAVLAIALLCTSIFPGTVFAEDTVNNQQQIGNHYNVIVPEEGEAYLEASPTLTGNTSESYADGKVTVDKTISATETENIFDIKLTVSTQEKIDETITSPDAATVIVIDCSGSMAGNRIASAKRAAQTFINNFVDENARRKIAIVRYSGSKNTAGYDGANTVQVWTDAKKLLPKEGEDYCDAIKGLVAGGATNTEAGLMLGRNLLEQLESDPELRTIENKNIILLTDGNPTLGVDDSQEAKYATELSTICPKDASGYSIDDVGRGNATTCDTHDDVETLASELKSSYGTYAIYVGNTTINCDSKNCPLNTTGANWLANDCGFTTYSASDQDLDKLTEIFQQILEIIQLKAQAWTVTDPMGANIDFVKFNRTLADTDPVNLFTYDEETNTITWDIKSEGAQEGVTDSNGVTTYTYELTYQVKLDTLASDYEAGRYYATNGITGSTYLITENTNGSYEYEAGTAYFNVPSVKGFEGALEFMKKDDSGNALAGAVFTLTHVNDEGEAAPSWTATATSDENGKVSFTNIPSGHTYTLEETGIPNGYDGDESIYQVTVSYGNTTHNLTDGIVINKLRTVDIAGTKVWDDANNQDGKRPSEITINLIGTVDGNVVVNEPVTIKGTGDTWEWSIEGLPECHEGKLIEYSITEPNVPEDYTSTIDGFVITNTHEPEKIDIVGSKTWDDANETLRPATITVNLTGKIDTDNDGIADKEVYSDSKNVSADENWEYAFIDLNKYDSGKLISYTVSEEPVAGYTATVEGYNIINKLNTTSAVVSKKVTGGLGDYDKTFTFAAKVILKDGETIYNLTPGNYTGVEGYAPYTVNDDGTIAFNLKHGESIKIENLPAGIDAQLVVEEIYADGYTTTVNGETSTKGTFVIEDNEVLAIEFVNDKSVTIDTGIFTDNAPYIVILSSTILALVAVLGLRKKIDNE